MQGTVKVGGIEVLFEANGATPVYYRHKFNRDLMVELSNLAKDNSKQFEIMESLAYIMAKQADATVSDNEIEWLSQFGPVDIFNAAPEIMAIYYGNTETTSEAKKK